MLQNFDGTALYPALKSARRFPLCVTPDRPIHSVPVLNNAQGKTTAINDAIGNCLKVQFLFFKGRSYYHPFRRLVARRPIVGTLETEQIKVWSPANPISLFLTILDEWNFIAENFASTRNWLFYAEGWGPDASPPPRCSQMKLPFTQGKAIHYPIPPLLDSVLPPDWAENWKYKISVSDQLWHRNFVFSISEPVIRQIDIFFCELSGQEYGLRWWKAGFIVAYAYGCPLFIQARVFLFLLGFKFDLVDGS